MKAKLKSIGLTAALLVMLAGGSNANNLQIGTPTQPAANQIQFTISWNNAWNNSSGAPANWDAAWVFVKQQDCTNGTPPPWTHVTLSSTPGNNSITGGSGNLQVDTAADGMGVFIRVTNASSPFFGNVSGTVTLQFASTPANTDNYKVFGIEMVYVPQGSYFLGDGTSATSTYFSFNPVTNPISSEAAISLANLGSPTGVVATGLTAVYPKGFAAFYCMKYEITQHQYVDFLNTLTYSQQTTYVGLVTAAQGNFAMGVTGSFGYNRNGVKIVTSGVNPSTPAVFGCDLGGTAATSPPNNVYNETFDGQDIACNWISWADMLGYLSWSGLRPMSELEYEKACRGPANAVNGEYAWGTTQRVAGQSYSNVVNNGQNGISELASQVLNPWSVQAGSATRGLAADSNGNNVGTPQGLVANSLTSGLQNFGPMRVGFAATGSTASRAAAGATYWGILDMTGNVWERCVGSFSSAAASFNGWIQGNGTVTTPANWPTNVTTSPFDAICRGGAWDAGNTTYFFGSLGTVSGVFGLCPVSSRYNYNNTNVTPPGLSSPFNSLFLRTEDAGGRGVRSHQ